MGVPFSGYAKAECLVYSGMVGNGGGSHGTFGA
jgi:hypothetical protein